MVNSIENELVILTKQTIDSFLSSAFPGDVIALYTFYYYTAKWQETNQIRCTTAYAAKGLGWSEDKVRRAKKELYKLDLIEDIQAHDGGGTFGERFIRLKYIVKTEATKPESDLFARFWKEYPKKKDKENARKAFDKLKVDEALLNTMLQALEWQKQTDDWQEKDGSFIPYPSTWLNGRRWEDERESYATSGSSFDTDDFFDAAIAASYRRANDYKQGT